MKKTKKKVSPIKYILVSLLILLVAIIIAASVNVVLSIINNTNSSIEHIIGMLEGIIGAIATGFVLYQLKLSEKTEAHQNDIEEATFLLQFNQTFIQDVSIVCLEQLSKRIEGENLYSRGPLPTEIEQEASVIITLSKNICFGDKSLDGFYLKIEKNKYGSLGTINALLYTESL